jgi:hypothetical protein
MVTTSVVTRSNQKKELQVKQVTGVEDAPYPAMQVGIPNQPLTHHQYF